MLGNKQSITIYSIALHICVHSEGLIQITNIWYIKLSPEINIQKDAKFHQFSSQIF
jgi:hypothetical protein